MSLDDYSPPTGQPVAPQQQIPPSPQPPIVVAQQYPPYVQVPPVRRKKKSMSTGAVVGISLGGVFVGLLLLCWLPLMIYVAFNPAERLDTSTDIVSDSSSSWTDTMSAEDAVNIIEWKDNNSSLVGWVLVCQNTHSSKTLSYVQISMPIKDGNGVYIGTAYGNASRIPPGATFEMEVTWFDLDYSDTVFGDSANMEISAMWDY
jgi:hypothetical protein